MAKYQQQDAGKEQPDSESALEDIVPPPALPTLTTLSGVSPPPAPAETNGEDPEVDLSQLSTMGVGLSAETEGDITGFLQGVAREFELVEWPSAAKVVRLTVIIIATILVAVFGLYFVDGFFYRMANTFFEGKI